MPRIGQFVVLSAMLSMLLAGQAYAARSEGDTKARNGTVRCGGNNFLRQGDTEIHNTSYVLRNFDSVQPIAIERIRFFDATGATLFDTSGGGLPPSQNGVLGPANNILNPNQTAQFTSDSILSFLAQNIRPIQFEVQWSASRRALTLDAVSVRIARQRDPATGAIQAERSRHAIECRSIVLR